MIPGVVVQVILVVLGLTIMLKNLNQLMKVLVETSVDLTSRSRNNKMIKKSKGGKHSDNKKKRSQLIWLDHKGTKEQIILITINKN